jgi:hypothetical protein
MKMPAQADERKLRMAYDLYGFVKLTNALEESQVDALEEGFDRIYKAQIGRYPGESDEPLPPLAKGLHKDWDYMKAFASARHVIRALHAVAGSDCVYIGADILCVYDGSIGPHRDTLYRFDLPKVLIFLSDCNELSGVHFNADSRSLEAGAFAVLSGSHFPSSDFSVLSSQLSAWPFKEPVQSEDVSPHFRRSSSERCDDCFMSESDWKSKYQGYSIIPFKRGDVVIFSSRALHGLLPTNSAFFSKLAAFLFLEGYRKGAGTCFKADSVQGMSDLEVEYASMPYSIRVGDLLIRDADIERIREIDRKPMGIPQLLSRGDPQFNAVFEPLTRIYRICEAEKEEFMSRRFSTSMEGMLNVFLGVARSNGLMLDRYYSKLDEELGRSSDGRGEFGST